MTAKRTAPRASKPKQGPGKGSHELKLFITSSALVATLVGWASLAEREREQAKGVPASQPPHPRAARSLGPGEPTLTSLRVVARPRRSQPVTVTRSSR
jgi:hypothetical protein